MTDNTASNRLSQERRNSTTNERQVLALEMIADKLALIHSDLNSIEKAIKDRR